MNIRNIVLTLMISAFFGAIHAETVVMIKNKYKDPIAVIINGQDAALIQSGKEERLWEWPKQIQIRTEKFGSRTHSGIQKEVEKVKNAAQQNPNLYATITITGDALNFYYNTDIKQAPTRPIPQTPSIWEGIFAAFKIYDNKLAEELLKKAVIEQQLCGQIIARQLYIMMHAQYSGSEAGHPLNQILYIFSNRILRNEIDFQKFKNDIGGEINMRFNLMRIRTFPEGRITFPAYLNITPDYLNKFQLDLDAPCPCRNN